MIRQPIVSVLGHVDHGKTTLLDRIRGSTVSQREAGGITQHIGATEVPIEAIREICGGILQNLKGKITLPGLLFIDTPGHAAFTTLRKRGGAISDLAVVVVDLTEGFQVQTLEALNILKTYKTPFLVAANKIDKIPGWRSFPDLPLLPSLPRQTQEVREAFDHQIYELVGKLYEEGFEAERFDRVKRFEKQISIVPLSALTGQGIPELLMLLVGLAQRFLGKELESEEEGPARGTVLEVKEETGLGTTLDVILYDGRIRKGDLIVVGGKREPIVTKVRSLLKPRPLDEIRDPRFRFQTLHEAHAACGIKVVAPELGEALAGSPLRVAEDPAKAIAEVTAEMEEVKIETDKAGIVVKADTLGSLEALVKMFREKEIPIKKADVGDVSHRDVVEAGAVKKEDPRLGALIAFNVKVRKDAEEKAQELGLPILRGEVIYRLLEEYEAWVQEVFEEEERKEFKKLISPAKIRLLPGYVFRVSKPAVVGVEILGGTLKANSRLMSEKGVFVGTVKGIQKEKENLPEAKRGMEVAVAIDGPVVGRQIHEGCLLYSELPPQVVRLFESKFKKYLSEDEIEVLEEIKEMKRKEDPFWGMGEE
jgi:translation initiation factor 5B